MNDSQKRKIIWILVGIILLLIIAGLKINYCKDRVMLSPSSGNIIKDIIDWIWGPSIPGEYERIRKETVPAKPGTGTSPPPGNQECNGQTNGWNNCYTDLAECGASGTCMKTCICDRLTGCSLSNPLMCSSGQCKAGKGDNTGCIFVS